MADLESEFHFAWSRVAARFGDDGADLARRLARRRRAVLVRPPRAWCLALRASDARLPEVATLLPADAADTANSSGAPRASDATGTANPSDAACSAGTADPSGAARASRSLSRSGACGPAAASTWTLHSS